MFARHSGTFFSSLALTSPANHEKESKRHQKSKGKSACVRNTPVFGLGMLEQRCRNAIVLWATPKKDGGLELPASEILRRLKRVFNVTSNYTTLLMKKNNNNIVELLKTYVAVFATLPQKDKQ